MEVGMVGLGRMGMNMATRLVRSGHGALGYDISPTREAGATRNGIEWKPSVPALVESLPPPRIVWIMVPQGKPVDEAIAQALPMLAPGDIIVDGGNSYYKDSMRRADELKTRGIYFLDCGTSGGIWGLDEGYCLMVGGDQSAYQQTEPIFAALATEGGYRLVGRSGAGHFVKMVHNGVEYGMLQAYGEGFEILHASQFDFDLEAVASLWNHGSVVRSWLLELAERAFAAGSGLNGIAGYIEDTGEGRWTVDQAIEQDVPAPVITASLLARLSSRQTESFSAKVIAALRHEFGGHKVTQE